MANVPQQVLRDSERTPKGGSNRLEIGLTDADADEIWGARFGYDIDGSSGIDESAGTITVAGDAVHDFPRGTLLRLRSDAGDWDNEGVIEVTGPGTYDGENDETTLPADAVVEEVTGTDTATIEPVWIMGGWHRLAVSLQGGNISRERDVTRYFDESDQLIAEGVDSDEVMVGNGSMENNDRFRLLLEWGETNFFQARYLLPTTTRGQFYEAPNGDLYADGRFYERATMETEGQEESTERDQNRPHPFTVSATRPGVGEMPELRKVVNLTQQEGWGTQEPDVSAFADDSYTSDRDFEITTP